MSSESAILSIPISIESLEAQMTAAHKLSQQLANLVKILGGPDAEGVAFIKAMSQRLMSLWRRNIRPPTFSLQGHQSIKELKSMRL